MSYLRREILALERRAMKLRLREAERIIVEHAARHRYRVAFTDGYSPEFKTLAKAAAFSHAHPPGPGDFQNQIQRSPDGEPPWEAA